MPKKTSSQKGKQENHGSPSPAPAAVPLVLTDYLPPDFSIPIPEAANYNFLDENGQIKRPPNSWICYRSESTRFMRELHTVDEKGNEKFLEQGLVSRLCSQMWNAMTPEERAPWACYAAMLAAEHKRQYPNYVFAPKTKEQKEKEKNEGKVVAKVTKRVPSKNIARAKAAPYPRPTPVSRLPQPPPGAGPSRLPNAPATYQPLPYIPPPSTDLSSNPYAALTTLPYSTMPPFKPFAMPLAIPPTTASPSLLDYTPSPGTTAVPTPEPSPVALHQTPVQPTAQLEEDENPLFEWEMDEFFLTLAQAELPSYCSEILSAEPQQGGSGILPVLSLETDPGMSVAVGNLPGQNAAHILAQQSIPMISPVPQQTETQPIPDLEQDWLNHPSFQGDFVSLESNEVWPGGEWMWGTGDTSTSGFGGQSLMDQSLQQQDNDATGLDSWYPLQGQGHVDPNAVDWSTTDTGMQSQDNYSMETEYIDQNQLNKAEGEVETYYTQETMAPSTYVPPAGAAFSSNRRVGGTWQLHTRS